MKIFSKILRTVLVMLLTFCLVLPIVGCNGEKEIIWVDGIIPEENVDPTVNSPSVKLPLKPQAVPSAPDTALAPTVGELTVSDSCYSLTKDGDNYVIEYNSKEALPAYSYIYAPVSNYHNKYPYFKIKANCEGVERIAIMAVYYEQFDANAPAITVYNNALIEGENTIVCDLSSATMLDKNYNAIINDKLIDKQIVGFIIMVDSNPKQVIDNYTGKMTITDIALVDDKDEDLATLYAPPMIANWQAFDYSSCDVVETKNDKTGNFDVEIDYSFSSGYPYVQTSILNYKSDFTNLSFNISGNNVKNVTIAIAYSLQTVGDSVGSNYLTYGMQVSSTTEHVEFDFSALEELRNDFITTVPGSYVKNLNPYALYIYIDTATEAVGGMGTLFISDIQFETVVDDGTPKVTSTWTVTGEGMNKSNVYAGGVGTLTYDKTQGWTAVTINVSSYNSEYKKLVVKVKFYGAKNLGIALGYASTNTVVQNSDGNTDTGVTLNHTETQGEDDNGAYVFHTYEIDFANVVVLTGGNLCDQSINKILLYIDAVAEINGNFSEVSQGSSITPRTMQFVGIEFVK